MAASVQWDNGPSEHPISLSSQLKLGLACLVVGTIVAWVNRFHDVPSGIY
jgi:hypothetical protein